METWLSLISDVGFPAIITLYLLHRIEKKLDKLNDSITELPQKMREFELTRKKPG
ncbi:YvrJ family protein [Pueribacillus sp. YX66]|uniref:YvrJ family protein n=1 Tax=Pueribacillus sp. YX66 TaxID=3229242 RepID=UPI00358D4C3C